MIYYVEVGSRGREIGSFFYGGGEGQVETGKIWED
jgi:hypothetical protein